ncbi:TonB family C-terminal domain protein [Bacteriovorax sp. BSW11_IV]|uniref:cell envelope integrity protein TolA n=1 Tax=Bacteriovorax sp. BSW11_IV TaxID=1353529 RepID=UPI00038A1B11|nr:energy transducer TonB [Bacteriovorax sp. BSW11_IV]EQC49063.1 TonB family C-terminal domain protein [Bacteriovorax sp. BSW11_IV]
MIVLPINEQKFRNYFFMSLVVHVIISIFIIGFKKYESHNEEILKNENLKLVQASVRVDVVAMPKFTIKELKQMQKEMGSIDSETPEVEAKPEVVQEEAPADGPELIKETKTKSFADMMKDLSNEKVAKKKVDIKDAFKEDSNKEKGLSQSERNRLKNLVVQGNKISEGVSLTGSGGSAAHGAFERYVDSLPNFIRPHWKLPSYLLGKELRCRIRVFISEEGKLIRAIVHESSGENEYDNKALEAVKSASPFPGLSKEFAQRGVAGEILLGFPL